MSSTPWSAARQLAWAVGNEAALGSSDVPLEQAAGRIAAAPLSALVDLPTASVSAMDGWAVAGDAPWRVGARVDMGSSPDSTPLAPSTARPITTGAPVPAGTFGVLRTEHGELIMGPDGGEWLHRGPQADARDPARDAHIRPRGEELERGTPILAIGVAISPPHLALAAACGHDTVVVRARPRVSVLVTGDEVLASGLPPAGSVRDALGPVLPGLVREAGAEPVRRRAVADTVEHVAAALASASEESDLILTTGGSSRGDTDAVRRLLVDAGGLVFDGVKMRPGHPVMLGRTLAGTPVLALPGNPLAAIVCFVSFGIPLIRGMLGLPEQTLAAIGVPPLPRDVSAAVARGLTVIVPASRTPDPVVSPWRGPAMLRGLAEADALLVIAHRHSAPEPEARLLELPW